MRENSGHGDAENNLRDPTLKEHETGGGNARAAGEGPSPDDRARGETSRADDAPPAEPYEP